jgi:uncharacterized membrane protein (DUF485 family)
MTENREQFETLEIRRTPKFLPFLITGGVFGLIVALIAWAASGMNQEIFGFLVSYGAGLGVAAGIIAATVIEGITRKRAKRVQATKLEG